MDRIEDEPVAFYLKHQRLIETWHGVRPAALNAAHLFLLSLHRDLEGLAGELGDDVSAWVRDDRMSLTGLHRESWAGESEPRVSICLEWKPGDTSFVDGLRSSGVRIHYRAPGGPELRGLIDDQVRHVRSPAGFPETNNWWAARRQIPTPTGEYWEDLSPYRRQLVEEVQMAWGLFAPAVDAALAAGAASATR